MNFAEELQQEIDKNYIEWKRKYDEDLRNITRSRIKSYGYASALCGDHIDTTSFKSWTTCRLADHKYLSIWIRENGFIEGTQYNSYGVKSVTWRL